MTATQQPFAQDIINGERKDVSQEARQRVSLKLWKRREISEEQQKGRALAIALKYGKNGEESLALNGGDVRDYKGASVTLTNFNWMGTYKSADAEQQFALPILRARARDLEENNPYAERYLAELEANVLGPEGMVLQMYVEEWDPTAPSEPNADGTPGKPGAMVPDEQANRKIKDAWEAWKRLGTCDVSGELSFHEIERLALRSTARDGDCLIRLVRNWEGNEFGFAVQLIEGDALDVNYNTVLPNGNIVIMGVEMDVWKRRVAYHILTRHPGDFFQPQQTGKPYRERVDASEIIHLRFLRRIGQTRGVSWFSPVMDLLEMLRGYEEAELISARSESCKGGYLYSDITPEGGFSGQPPNPEDVPKKKLTPGQIDRLPYGVKFQAHNPTHPNGNYQTYRSGVLRGIASGLSVSYNILANDLTGTSYSSLRGGLLDEREQFKMLQSWFISRFEMLIFQAWLESAMLNRKVQLPFFKFDKFNAPYFQGRRWDWVDPIKDIEAIDRAIQIGLTSRRAEVAKKGGDIRDIAKEQQQDLALESQYGLSWTANSASNKPQPGAPAKDTEEPAQPGEVTPGEDTPPAQSQDTEPA
jgi:lambda family phage portal protein